jgi:anaerobic magnesium-protoporphyrin IX monomethyl ester cyclase
MAKILLIQPPIYISEYTARGSAHTLSILPPMGLAYIASYLRKNGNICEIMDGMAIPFDLDVLVSKSSTFDVIGITAVSTFAKRVHEIIGVLKRNKVRAPVVVGGPHATVLPESCLRNGADYVVIGEGEITMLELVNALAFGNDVGNVNGIAFLNDDKFYRTPARSKINNLDDIPLPARDLLPMGKYRSSEARSKKQPSHSLFTSRGCTGYCSFCNKMIFGSKVRYYSVDRIVEEFFLLRDRYGAQDVAVWDDNFLADRNIAHAVCDSLIKNNFKKTWSIEARIDTVDRDILLHAKEAGCDFIAYGIESGSQKILDSMNKRITLGQVRKVIKMTKEVGINIRGYFMMGMPNESLEDMDQTISFAKELNIDVATFTLFVPLPGTVEYQRALKTGTFIDPEYYLHEVYPEFNFPSAPLYVPEGMTSEDLLEKHKSAYNKYYFRLPFLLKSALAMRSFQDITRNFKGMLNLLINAFIKIKKNRESA